MIFILSFKEESASCPQEADICTGGVAVYSTQSWKIELNGQSEMQDMHGLLKTTKYY